MNNLENSASLKNVFVLFHANCFDGTGAKYAAWCKFHEDATYIPVQYGQPFPSQVPLDLTTELYIIDFSYSREILDDVYSKVGSLVVLDHHKTAEAALKGAPYAEFDMERSGAVMAWNFFHPKTPVPTLLYHVQDGDLWKFKMEKTKAIRAALPLLGSKMQQWAWITTSERSLKDLVASGETLLAMNDIKVEAIVKNNVKVLPYKGFKAGVFNTTTLVSEAGNAVYDDPKLGVDFSMSYFVDKEGTPVVSFRSKQGSGVDVSALAKELGGGGHYNASGAPVTWNFLSNLYSGVL